MRTIRLVKTRKEIDKCKEDPIYYYYKYIRVDGKKPKKLLGKQEMFLRHLYKHGYAKSDEPIDLPIEDIDFIFTVSTLKI